MKVSPLQIEKCKKCGDRVAGIGIAVNLILVIMKMTIGITSGSKSLIADGLHSSSNIITAFAILFSQKITGKKKNDAYPFGFGKAEFIAAGFTSVFITAAAVFLIAASIRHLLQAPRTPPHLTAFLAAVISIIANEMLFRYMRCAGTRLKSQTILANAWANRADCFSSLAVVIGVIGSKLGYHHLDPICALIVVAVIIKVSISILIDSVKALMDSSVNNTYGAEISTIVSQMKDVHGIKTLKTRHIGQKVWVEIDILIDAKHTMKEGQEVARNVRKKLLEQIRDLDRVMVYFAPAETEHC